MWLGAYWLNVVGIVILLMFSLAGHGKKLGPLVKLWMASVWLGERWLVEPVGFAVDKALPTSKIIHSLGALDHTQQYLSAFPTSPRNPTDLP